MATFEVDTISVKPDVHTRNRGQTLIPRNRKQNIWYGPSVSADGSQTGSAKCCTYLMPKDTMTPLSGFELRAKSVVGPVPGQTSLWNVVGSLNGVDIFKSKPTLIMPDPAPTFVDICLVTVPVLPVRLAGDFSWRLETSINSVPQKPIIATVTTRLEICCVFSQPPSGPLVPLDKGTRARPDFGNVYPIDVFRLFLPSLHEASALGPSPWQAFIERSMKIIWNMGIDHSTPSEMDWSGGHIRYEARQGASNYLDDVDGGPYGGAFDMVFFVSLFFDAVNCYDLAALAQMAACIMLDSNGVEVGDSRWIFCDNYGYIKPGPLIGWTQYPDCNSPFFLPNKPWYFADAKDTNRQAFGNHAWVEIQLAGSSAPKVLDATHCLQGTGPPWTPSSGSEERDDYVRNQSDLPIPGEQRVYYVNPDTRLPQIGLKNIDNAPAEPLSATSRPQMVNGASCADATIDQEVQKACPGATLTKSKIRISSKKTQKTYRFSSPLGNLYVEISVFSDAVAADKIREVLWDLMQTGDSSSFFPAPDIGDNAFMIDTEVVWTRNEVLGRVWIALAPKSDTFNPPALTTLTNAVKDVAIQLDQHLNQHTTVPSAQPLVKSVLPAQEGNAKHEVDSVFTIHLDNIDDAEEQHVAEVLPLGSVILTGQPKRGVFEFLAVKPGMVTLQLNLAHRSSLAVQTHVVTVEIVPATAGP